MDQAQAKAFVKQLQEEQSISGWKIHECVGHGKSAVVMRADKEGRQAALKIFHPELIERFGREAQLLRVDREKRLIGESHSNIVEILETGACELSGHIYVAMEFVVGKSLRSKINDFSSSEVAKIVENLARAAKFLEDMGMVHRDIKPDNIMISDFDGRVVLLDFGVMRPVGDSAATDQMGYSAFVGTHQYAPSEMIHGHVEDTLEGWRAVSFYQIGGVLHDLLMKRPLFDDCRERIADLVKAIDEDTPQIPDGAGPIEQVALVRKCLLKDPGERLRLTSWSDFYFSEKNAEGDFAFRLKRLSERRAIATAAVKTSNFDLVEQSRFLNAKSSAAIEALRARIIEVLDELRTALPLRTVKGVKKTHPEASILCSFEGQREQSFGYDFNFEFSLFIHSENVCEVFARAGKGSVPKEIGWASLGSFLGDFSDSGPAITNWILVILEELADIGDKNE